jgi:hypothetical protein
MAVETGVSRNGESGNDEGRTSGSLDREIREMGVSPFFIGWNKA